MSERFLGEGDLLDRNGALADSGYAFSQVRKYDRTAIKSRRLRIKEWDYYCFGDSRYAVALTVADNSYMSLGSVSLLDFSRLGYITESKIGLLSKGKLGMPSDCGRGSVKFAKGGAEISFDTDADGKRELRCVFEKFRKKDTFECEITLEPYVGDNITVAVPFAKPRLFYYNTKVNCLRGSGRFSLGSEKYEFDNGSGCLDWGRGVWPYKNRWYWSSLSCDVDGNSFGLNLGYGFGQPTATENVIFYNGKAHKLGNVDFDIPYTFGEVNYLKPWTIKDDAGRLEVMFYPLVDRRDKMRALWLMTDQHQVFGRFYGKAVLDDGSIVSFADKPGFAERVINKW